MCAILQGWAFFARPTRSKRSRKKCAKRAQISAKKCKRAQIQKTLLLNSKGLLTHVYLCLSEHPDTICREKCKTTAHKNLWRADFSKRNTFSFTSVNVRFRAETQRHVNLRYFGGPRIEFEVVRLDRFCCPIAMTIAVQNLCAVLLSHLFLPLHAITNHNLNVSHSTRFLLVLSNSQVSPKFKESMFEFLSPTKHRFDAWSPSFWMTFVMRCIL